MSQYPRVLPDTTEPTAAPQRLLALSAEIAGTRACLVEPVNGAHRLVGWLNLARAGEVMMPLQVAETCRRLGQRLGCALWDEELNMPFMRSINPVRFPPIQMVSTTISARAPVRVFVAGLSSDLSASAARAAVAASPSTVAGEVVYDIDLDVGQISMMLGNSQPDVLVIVGGFDRSGEQAQNALLALCRMVAQAVARQPRPGRPVVVFAGSAAVAERVPPLFRLAESSLSVELADNVLPEPGLVRRAGLARVLTYQYWRLTQRIIGFKEMARWATSPGQAVTVETSFIQMMQAWALHQGLAWVHGLYAGPAWWLHVWSGQTSPGAQVLFTEPGARPEALDKWPPLTLVSGEWPAVMGEMPRGAWWDKRGLAPVVAAIGQVSPRAMMDVLENDLLRVELS